MMWLYRSTTIISSTTSVPKRDHPAHVVAGQVHQHHVLGHLLGVLDQLALQPPVLLGGGAPGAGAGDGPGHHRPVAQADHGLGRGAHHGDLGEAQEVEVRAGVDQPQDPVDVEGVGAEVIEVEPLGQHHLEDVARRSRGPWPPATASS